VIRVAFPTGPVSDYGPPALGLVLVMAFILIAQDPADESPSRPQ